MPDYYSPATAAAAHAAAVPLSPDVSPSPSPPPPPELSSSPPPPWSLRSQNSGDSAGGNSNANGNNSRFSINRASSSRSNVSSRGSGGGRRRNSLRANPRGGGGAGGRRPGGIRGALATASSTGAWLWRWLLASGNHALAFYVRLSPLYRALFLLFGAVSITLGVLMLVYSHRVFAALGPIARGWHDLPGGWVLVWLLVFITGFPPIIGYSTACTVAGLVYGFPWGWPIAASANVAGSLAAFLASRGVLSGYVDRLVGSDHRFVALGQVLRHDGLWVLAAVRFCPLPYSLSNGFLATIPSITPRSFALSTAMASPKLLVHVFIGSRLAKLAEDGDSMSAGSKTLNYISMAVFGMVGMGVGIFIFRRTMARAEEIAAAAAEEEGRSGGGGSGGRQPGVYADADHDDDDFDDNAPLMDPEDADVAALMDDDDISLWAADHFADGDGGDIGDADEEEAAAASGNKSKKSRNSTGSYHDESDADEGGRR